MPGLKRMNPRTLIPDGRWSVAAVLCVVAVSIAIAGPPVVPGNAEWELLQEHWYVVQIGGARAGSMVSTVESDGERFRTGAKVNLTIGRGPASTTIEISGSFEETADGRPLVMRARQVMGTQPVESEWRFLENRV